VVTAEEVYVDPSALARLYLHQEGSREISAWRSKTHGPLPVTHHGRTEVTNALCRAAFLGHLDKDRLAEALSDFTTDFANGRLYQADLLWRAALDRASDLSRRHTPEFGTRSLDVLHVACALELKLRYFLTFDQRQQKLAVAAALRLVRV
jgi:predicted nucleic acid-binding protein